MAKHQRDTWRPSPGLELMLHAAIDDGDSARVAWEQWLAAGGMQETNDGSQRYYPLLYRNLQKLGVKSPEINRLALSYRNSWIQNQILMRVLATIIADFEEQGIPTLVLKGCALLGRYYKDLGTRPMSDVDVLVPVAQTDAAIARLAEQGWRCNKPLHLVTAEYRAPINGIGFTDDRRALGCDLHWHVFHLQLNAVYDSPLWEASVPVQIGTVQSRALCPEHQLIHTFFTGCMNEANTNKRWLPDALMLIKNEPAMDWSLVVSECLRLYFVQPVAAMLDYLRLEWKMPVPVETVTALANTPIPYFVQQAYQALDLPKEQRNGMQVLWLLYAEYVFSQPQIKGVSPIGLMRFISHRWSLDGSLKQTLNYALLRLRGVGDIKARRIVRKQPIDSPVSHHLESGRGDANS